MNKRILSLNVCLLLGASGPAFAATNIVVQGDDFQAKIDAAAPGDTMVVQSGIYAGNLDFSKVLAIVCSGTNGIRLTGSVTVSAPGTVSFVQAQFLGGLQVQTNATLVLSLSTNSSSVTLSSGNLQAFDSQFQDLSATGGKITVKRCSFASPVNITNTAFEGLRVTAAAKITATAPVGSGIRFVLVQSTMASLWLTGYQAFLGYSWFEGVSTVSGVSANGLRSLISLTDCDTVMVGNLAYQFNPDNQQPATTVNVYRGTVKAYNNRFMEDGSIRLYIFAFIGGIGELVNNSLDRGYPGDLGILVQNSAGPITLRANVLSGVGGIDSQPPQAVAECSYSCVESGDLFGIPCTGCLFTSPQINQTYYRSLSATNAWLSLLPGSPCIHAGPPDAVYNNTDGTRNTMGYTGGPLWNPANYTNNNPMVFWMLSSPQTILKGLQSTIQVKAAATAGH